jgi:hypothetical protein
MRRSEGPDRGEFVRWALSQESRRVLKPRESRVIVMRYDPSGRAQRTLAEVGRVLAISRKRVRQIEANAYDRLRRWRERQKLIELLEAKTTALSPIEVLELPQGRYGALKRAGYSNVEELEAASDAELLARARQFGIKSLKAVRDCISQFRRDTAYSH